MWDRQNTDLAALRIMKEKPIFYIGWDNFLNVAPNYMLQQPNYPITGLGIEIHNVFLSHAADPGDPWPSAVARRVPRSAALGLPAGADDDA